MPQSNNGRPLVLLTIALVALVGGCITPGSTVCSDGRTCPRNTRCDVENHLCVGDAQEVACNGHGEGAECVVAGVKGNCRAGLCKLLFCGDGMRTASESCDGTDLDGKTCADLNFYSQTTGLKCKDDCTFDTTGCTGACGDKKINGTELCDGSDLGGADCRTAGFYDAPGLRCSPFCTLDVSACTGSCGDGKVNGPEQCDGAPPLGKTCADYGFDRGRLGCSALCGPQLDGCGQIGWRSVLSKDQALNGVWGSSPTDVFVVGNGGTIFRGSGTTWTPMISNTTVNLWNVWGTGPDHVFAVGGENTGVVLLWDGTTWKQLDAPADGPYTSVWGFGPDDVFVMDRYAEVVVHWDGKVWSKLPPVPAGHYKELIWGSAPSDLYAIGDGIARWDGKKWAEAWSPPSGFISLQAIWGSGPGDVFAVGPGIILHWNGAAWSQTDLDVLFQRVWGSGPKDVFAVGYTGGGDQGPLRITVVHWDGASWSDDGSINTVATPPGRPLAGIWGSGPDDVYIAAKGSLLHSNGDSWFATPTGLNVTSLWAAGPDDLFASGPRDYPAAPPCPEGPPPPAPPPECPAPPAYGQQFTVSRFAGRSSSATNVQVASADTAVPFDGGNTTMWGSSSTDVFALAGGYIQHWDGATWSPSYTPAPTEVGLFSLRSVWGSGPNNVFAVEGNRKGTPQLLDCPGTGIEHWDGMQWTAMRLPLGMTCLNAVWLTSQGEVFAVGNGGEVVHSDGTTWSSMTSGSTEDLVSVWGSGPHDVFAVGAAGTVLHFDGETWSSMPSATTASLQLVRGSGPADVFAVGGKVLLHLRGGAWETIAMPLDFSATSLWVTPSQVFLADGTGAHKEGGDQLLHLYRNGVTCVGPEKNCGDGWDNDCDGLADSADPDCAGLAVEQCANGFDDDGDGLIDCKDPGCVTFPACRHR